MNSSISLHHPRIADDSHARAVLNRELYAAEQRFDRLVSIGLSNPLPKSRIKRFDRITRVLGEALEPAIVYEAHLPLTAGSRRQCYTLVSVERYLQVGERNLDLAQRKLLACSRLVVDPKYLQRMSCRDAVFVTEHALERVVRRNQCQSMKDIIGVIGKYLLRIVSDRGQALITAPGGYVLVGPDGFMPIRYDAELAMPLVMTWVPRALWWPHQEAKLSSLARHCELSGEMRLIGGELFQQCPYFVPMDRLGTHINKI